jgi:hypothetical protein
MASVNKNQCIDIMVYICIWNYKKKGTKNSFLQRHVFLFSKQDSRFIIAKVFNITTHCIGQVPQFDDDVGHPYGLSASGTPASGVNAKGTLGFSPTG